MKLNIDNEDMNVLIGVARLGVYGGTRGAIISFLPEHVEGALDIFSNSLACLIKNDLVERIQRDLGSDHYYIYRITSSGSALCSQLLKEFPEMAAKRALQPVDNIPGYIAT